MKATAVRNRQWIYVKRPTDRVTTDHFELRETELDTHLAKNEVLLQAQYISVDPYMRIQQAARDTWEPPHPLGVVQRAGVISRVLQSDSEKFKEGDWVLGYNGWQTHDRCHAVELQKLDANVAPVTTALGVLGMPGRTAWFGLMEAGRPKPGETVVVSGAAGAVGSLVVQFAKRAGCKVLAIAGSDAKCDYLSSRLKADWTLNYRKFKSADEITQYIKETAGGVDVYFDNVGGMITDGIISAINLRARVIICGAISQYDGKLDQPELAPRFLHHFLFQRATIQGILARDYNHRMAEMVSIVGPWVRDREIVYEETIIDGFENLPNALNSLFEGQNLGKVLVKVSH